MSFKRLQWCMKLFLMAHCIDLSPVTMQPSTEIATGKGLFTRVVQIQVPEDTEHVNITHCVRPETPVLPINGAGFTLRSASTNDCLDFFPAAQAARLDFQY